MTGDDGRAEDLVQEVMLKMWSIRGTLERYDSKEALAVAILKNKARDMWRHDSLEWGTAAGGEEPAVDGLAAERADEVELVKLIVEHLPPLQARLFRMKEIEGYDNLEIMQITGCTAESLRQNLSRARRRIVDDFARITRKRIGNDK